MECVKCPCCNNELILSDYNIQFKGDLTLNSNNISYPKHFYHFGDGVDVNNSVINNWIQDALKYLEENDSDYYTTGSGNSLVVVLRVTGDDSYNIYVAKNYSECEIPINGENNE